MTCRIADCGRPVFVKSRELCSIHYERWRLKGDPEAVMERIYFDDELRFWSKVNKTDTCWLWTGTTVKSAKGEYGRFVLQGGIRPMAHRWAYEQLVGRIPDGHQLDHLCRVTLCVRPDHLEPVTQAENIRRENLALGRTSPTCREPGCDGPHRCFGMCNAHYLRWKKAGRPALQEG